MSDPRIDIIRRLAHRPNNPALKRTIDKSRSVDIASAITLLPLAYKKAVWNNIEEEEKAAEVLVSVEEHDRNELVDHIDFHQLVRLLQIMEVDDETDIISELPASLQSKVLEAIEEQDRTQVEDLMAFAEDSAGGLMHLEVLRLQESNTCRDAINHMQTAENVEMAFYLYVENDSDHLVGVISLRALLTNPPSTKLKEIMITDLITVTPEASQEEVAKLVSRYDLLALPVVDHAHRLLGLITIDDVVDVIQDIANKNMMLMAGMDEEHDPRNPKIFRAFRQRFTWLSITLVGGIGMAEVIGLFEDTLKTQAYLAGFIPVILGTGGNVGTQAATIAVRNLATGHMGGSGTLSIIFKEARVGTLLGISFGIILGLYVLLSMWATPMFAVAISCSIIITVVSAAILGMLVPFTLDKIGIDPAVATGPFVTTGIDLIAILIYFSTCQMILQ